MTVSWAGAPGVQGEPGMICYPDRDKLCIEALMPAVGMRKKHFVLSGASDKSNVVGICCDAAIYCHSFETCYFGNTLKLITAIEDFYHNENSFFEWPPVRVWKRDASRG